VLAVGVSRYRVSLSAARDSGKKWPELAVDSVIAELEGPLASVVHAGQSKALTTKIDTNLRAFWAAIDAARGQMAGLLQRAPAALQLVASLEKDPKYVSRESASLLPQLFYNFEMKFGWARIVSPVGASAVLADWSGAFGKALQRACYPRQIADAVAGCVACDLIVKATLDEIWSGIPAEFMSDAVPAEVVPLCLGAEVAANLTQGGGGAKLSQQFRVLQDGHACAGTRASLKKRRGADGPMFASEGSEACVAARSTLAVARASLARPSSAECFDANRGATGADIAPISVAKFDGCLGAADLSSACAPASAVEKWA
ncbi:unnamed protein product, partial [Prorocentrum cordatum]